MKIRNMKNISLLLLVTALASHGTAFTMENDTKKSKTASEETNNELDATEPTSKKAKVFTPQNKVYVLENHRLTISDEELQQIDDLESMQVQDGPTLKSLRELQVLALHNNRLTSVHTELGNLTSLQQLLLHNNQLASVPTELGNCTNLLKFWLNNNQLTSVPAELGSLTKLQVLGLQNNQLTLVPTELGNGTNLEDLRLHNNLLISVPTELGNLTNLQVLGLSSNQLTSIPNELGNLTRSERESP